MSASLLVFHATLFLGGLSLLVLVARRLAHRAVIDEPADMDSESACEVVRISRIVPHPNADRLELARFTMAGSGKESGYEVVVGKGEYRVGDLAVYLSVDSVVPLDAQPFVFLQSRPDAANKAMFRIRAARIRNVFSQGLLVPPPDEDCDGNDHTYAYGEKMWDRLNVVYFRTPEPGLPTVKTAQPKAPPPVPEYGVVSLKKDPDLFEVGELVHITEKVHGANARYGWVRKYLFGFIPWGWRFFIGSHRAEKGLGNAGYYGEDVWADMAAIEELAQKLKPHRGLVLYGEIFGRTSTGKPIQDMTYGRPGPSLVVFDVFDTKTKTFLPMADRLGLLYELGLQRPPSLGQHVWQHGMGHSYASGETKLGFEKFREGVVIEALTGRRRKGKYVSQEYLLRSSAQKAA